MISLILFCLLMTWYGLGALVNILSIGKERKPLTSAEVAAQLIVVGGFIWIIAANWDWS